MRSVRLGNNSALDRGEPLEGQLITSVSIPDDWSIAQAVKGISDPVDGLWKAHSSAEQPAWVESEDDELVLAISEYYGDIPIGRTEGEWK